MTPAEVAVWNDAIEHAIEAVANTTDGADPRLWDALERLKRNDSEPLCPRCQSRVVEQERRPNGNSRCEKGHWFASSKAVLATIAAVLCMVFVGCTIKPDIPLPPVPPLPPMPPICQAFEQHMATCPECSSESPGGGPSGLCEQGFDLLRDCMKASEPKEPTPQ